MPRSKFEQGLNSLRIAQICQICNKKTLTNQKPPLWSCDFEWRSLIGQNFLISDLAYLSNSKTILPLVKNHFNIFFRRKDTFEAHSSNFIFDAFKEWSIMVYFEKKLFKHHADQKLLSPIFFLKSSYLIGQCSDFYLQ